MTLDLDTALAPRALTLKEVLEVTADGFILVGLTHRAVTHAGLWNRQDALYGCAEDLLECAFSKAKADLDDWLADMKTDGTPRFYNSEVLMKQLREIDSHYVKLFLSVDNAYDIEPLVEELHGRDFTRLLAVTI